MIAFVKNKCYLRERERKFKNIYMQDMPKILSTEIKLTKTKQVNKLYSK